MKPPSILLPLFAFLLNPHPDDKPASLMPESAPVSVYHIYILASATGVLYTGVTNHLERRVAEHKQKRLPGFTKHTMLPASSTSNPSVMCETPFSGRNRSSIGAVRRSWRSFTPRTRSSAI